MRYSSQITSIGTLRESGEALLAQVGETREPIIITKDGEAVAVLQDIHSFERTEQTLALLKILALGRRQDEQGQTVTLAVAVERIRSRRRDD